MITNTPYEGSIGSIHRDYFRNNLIIGQHPDIDHKGWYRFTRGHGNGYCLNPRLSENALADRTRYVEARYISYRINGLEFYQCPRCLALGQISENSSDIPCIIL